GGAAAGQEGDPAAAAGVPARAGCGAGGGVRGGVLRGAGGGGTAGGAGAAGAREPAALRRPKGGRRLARPAAAHGKAAVNAYLQLSGGGEDGLNRGARSR